MNEQSSPFLPTAEPEKSSEPVGLALISENHRLAAACSYLGILLLIPLLADKDDEFVRFHVRQGIVVFVLEVIASIGFLSETAGTLVMLALVLLSIVAAWRTYKGKKWLLPVLGHYAQRIQL